MIQMRKATTNEKLFFKNLLKKEEDGEQQSIQIVDTKQALRRSLEL